MADVGSVTFTSSAGKQVTIPVPAPATAVYVTSTGRQVTAAEIEEWAGRIPGRPVRAVLRRQTRRAEGRQSERDVVAARPAPLLKGLVRGHGQTNPNPPTKGNLVPRSAVSDARRVEDRIRQELEDVRDDLDRERQVSAMLRRQLDAVLARHSR